MKKLILLCSVMMLIGRQAAATFELNDNVGGGKSCLVIERRIVQEQDKGSQPEDKTGGEEDKGYFFPL